MKNSLDIVIIIIFVRDVVAFETSTKFLFSTSPIQGRKKVRPHDNKKQKNSESVT